MHASRNPFDTRIDAVDYVRRYMTFAALWVMCLKLIQLYKLFPWKWLFVKLMGYWLYYIALSPSFPFVAAAFALLIEYVLCAFRAKFATWIVANECKLNETAERVRETRNSLQQQYAKCLVSRAPNLHEPNHSYVVEGNKKTRSMMILLLLFETNEIIIWKMTTKTE